MNERCTCGAQLVGLVEQWTGECETCSPPPSLDVRFRSSVHIATVSENARTRIDREAARVASFGYTIEHELAQIGPEPGDLCEHCHGEGWVQVDDGDAYIECDCQRVSS